MTTTFLVLIFIFLTIMFAIGIWSNSQVSDKEDFIVGGRSFNSFFTTFSLFATWFGAGTLITATDEIQNQGLRAINLEPLGAGLCLLIAGIFWSKKLWDLKILTLSDLFRLKFGKRAEFISVVITIPIYIGWIAVQFVALATLLNSFFNVEPWILILLIAFFAISLTMVGGLWSVTVTDSAQVIIILIGLFILFCSTVGGLSGFETLWSNTPVHLKEIFPSTGLKDKLEWVSVILIASLGNISGQDLLQRIFSAKSPKVARRSCVSAGIMYIGFGTMPALLGIFSWQLLNDNPEGNVIAKLSQAYLPPWITVVFTLCVCATVFSTLTSALLAPASVLAQNYLSHKYKNKSSIYLCRISVLLMGALSLIVSFIGENFYSILEESYALGLVCFFPPLAIGLYEKKKFSENACLFSMSLGLVAWLSGFVFDMLIPSELLALFLSFIGYYAFHSLAGTKLAS